MGVRVSLSSIADVLRRYRQQFRWLDVLTSSVEELVTPPADLRVLRDGDKFVVEFGQDRLEVALDGQRGVARFSLVEQGAGNAVAFGALLGAGVGAALARPKSAPESALLGLLVGGLAGALTARAQVPDPNRVVALVFDDSDGNWRLYSGPWRQWALDALWPPPGVEATG